MFSTNPTPALTPTQRVRYGVDNIRRGNQTTQYALPLFKHNMRFTVRIAFCILLFKNILMACINFNLIYVKIDMCSEWSKILFVTSVTIFLAYTDVMTVRLSIRL